jgi:hypothetical protein
LSARWTDQDYADYQARRGLKIEIVSVEPKVTNVQISREVKRDYKTEFEQQLSLVGIQAEREFYFARPRKWRADFRVVGTKILIEYEGGLFMESGGAHKAVGNILRDIEKYNACAIAGWLVVRITPKHVASGDALKWVEDALKSSRTNSLE